MGLGHEKGRAAAHPSYRLEPAQLRSARAARLSLELLLELVSLLPEAPIVLPPEPVDPLADGEVGELELLLGVLLEPEAPIELVERSVVLPLVLGDAAPPLAPGELLELAPDEPSLLLLAPGALLLPELWATATPPNARAAAAARAVRVVLVALMLNSLIDMLGNAPAVARRLKQD